VPIRNEEYDWDYPVPGNTSATEWKGVHPHEDLVQITNPEQGFMQNCNISPGTMMPNSPLTKDKYPSYIYNDRQDRSNSRGRAALRLLGAETKLTEERAKEIALNTTVDRFKIWQAALESAINANTQSYDDLAEAANLIINWNGHLDAENTAAALYRIWRRECTMNRIRLSEAEDGSVENISKKDQKKVLDALRKAKNFLTEKFGSFQVPWGETVRLKRGDKTWPVSGGSFSNGVNVLRAAGGRLSQETGITTVRSGQSCCTVVILSDPIRSFSILPWGQSDDPESPHYTDQAEELFSKSKFKSTYLDKEELMNNLESEKVLVIPDNLNRNE
jgi:acyl-homoserine lactone acylase PvdQ